MKNVYIALAYTGYEERSFKVANIAAFKVMQLGHIPLSPISMAHPIVLESKDNDIGKILGDWETWKRIDYSYIDWCDEIWVINFDTDATINSIGVNAEIEYGRKNKKKLRFVDVDNDNLFSFNNKLESLF
jgi:hypothetical protein